MGNMTKDVYLMMLFNSQGRRKNPKEMSKYITKIQQFIQSDAGYEFTSKYCTRPGNYLYGEYMKERTKRILSKTNNTQVTF